MAVSGESKTSLDKIRFMPERDPSALVVAGYRYSILCPINKGFCNLVACSVEPRCRDEDLRYASNRQLVAIEWRDGDAAASGDTTAEATARSADHSGDQSGAERSLTSLDSVRVEARMVENRRTGCPSSHLHVKWN